MSVPTQNTYLKIHALTAKQVVKPIVNVATKPIAETWQLWKRVNVHHTALHSRWIAHLLYTVCGIFEQFEHNPLLRLGRFGKHCIA